MVFYIGYVFVPITFLSGALLLLFVPIYFLVTAKCLECRTRNTKSSAFCRGCGINITQQGPFMENAIFNRKTTILSFFIPFLGLYQFFAYRNIFPDRSRYNLIIGIIGIPIIFLNLVGGLFFLSYYSFEIYRFIYQGGPF